jgi:hypothetical protein
MGRMFRCAHNNRLIPLMCFLAGMVLLHRTCPAQVDFARDIKPILSNHCFACHGPDGNRRATDFRLDIKDSAMGRVSDGPAIVPGDPSSSVLILRVDAADDDFRMPPPDSQRQLSAEQITLLKRWVEQGAVWQEHWSFTAPGRPALPDAAASDWSCNEIDRFIYRKILQAGMRPSPAARRESLIRRASLDLTGLPPTVEEVDKFLADRSPTAWEKVVDRLLASPRFGEQMAVAWLDAARYADTSGYQSDGPRDMWRWRDWVIDAYNANMPFDQFTIEQLAGDMLPSATLSQQIASGFNRNHRGNAEGGIVPEEYQVEYVVDRVDTTCTVWLGLTVGCARCHDHKYDPISQEDFYRLFAYFNNIPEDGRALKEGNSPPLIKAPTEGMQHELLRLDKQRHSAEELVQRLKPKLQLQQEQWESASAESTGEIDSAVEPWTVEDGLVHRFRLEGDLRDDRSVADRTSSAHSESDSRAQFESGLHGEGLQLAAEHSIELGDRADFGYFDSFTIALWVRPAARSGTILSRMTPVEEGDGYYLHLQGGRLQVNLVKRWLDDSIRVTSRRALQLEQWQHLVVSYDGSRRASGIQAYLGGRPLELQVDYDGINQSFATGQPLRLGGSHAPFTGGLDEILIYDRVLTPEEAAILAVPESIEDLLAIPRTERHWAQAAKLARYFREQHATHDIQQAFAAARDAHRQWQRHYDSMPTVMVMQEMQTPRETHILHRGQYDAPGERVWPGLPAVFAENAGEMPRDRLELAQWLVSHRNPLTARVAMNRMWQKLFGAGIVRTSEDFGAQGSLPSHPELLDYLACEFMDCGWDVKAMIRMILLSATYQQDSAGTADSLTADPENQLLSRGARIRLAAEAVRDQALFVGGLLNEQRGGPSVFPYQPEGLWKEIASTTRYDQSHGSELYRRSLYSYWKRTVPPPTMMNMDASSREFCVVDRSRTNTPLQALMLMNETGFVEAARAAAERVLGVPEWNERTRINFAFRLITARHPSQREHMLLASALASYRSHFANHPRAAEELQQVGEFSSGREFDSTDMAAWTMVMSLILNLDEVIVRE